ncbi:MAG TPA: indolepyruvate ferredoxin oxidoreductase family protein [Burkholderiales bacterium]|nr:indolepyruvate ferredoxin oxidoreductase family protein [Burkholderiales bacterium]
MQQGVGALRAVALEDRYVLERGTVFLSGIQALVRLPLEQRRRDARAGLNTAGFVSGYRGSPLGGYDLALWQAKRALDAAQVRFEPGLNEELAATAVWGTQQTEVFGGGRYDGVFGIWYAKNPGVDRAGDALKHANAAGTARHGGVLAISGDDPGASSSTLPNQCEPAFIAAAMPVLYPAGVAECLEFGLLGFALSRYAGLWVGFKTVADTVESTATVALTGTDLKYVAPQDFTPPPGGLHARWPDDRWSQDERLHRHKLPAAVAFARANGIDRAFRWGRAARLGIVTAGKAYLDVREALRLLGIDAAAAGELGVAVYKLGLVWPVEPEGLRAFADGVAEVLVIEERQPVIESEAKRLAYNWPADRRPVIVGKQDERGAPLVPATGELSPLAVARIIAARLGDPRIAARLPEVPAAAAPTALPRVPHFCAGCPHNRSTVVPEGSVAMAGIGCHSLAMWQPGSRTMTLTQMGGEGANWVGLAPFVATPHMFQNMGDGTYYHSGLLAIRAALAAGTSITFKVLVNDAAAMTGGQPVEGSPTAEEIARQLVAEGVERVALVGETLPSGVSGPGVSVHHRDDLGAVQRELRGFRGVSAIVYDQVCATEKRRRRRRGELAAPTVRPFINTLVCEGCGDCVVQSGCVAVQPVETPFGRKRRIDPAACNVDLSCLEGFCPSFVTVEGGAPRRRDVPLPDAYARLPEPSVAALGAPVNVLVAGVGGSGVITVGALLGMAAHLEGKGALVLDNTGLARKGGAVATHVRIARDAGALHAPRIDAAQADVLLACDLIVAASPAMLGAIAPGRTQVVANRHPTLTAAQLADPDAQCDFGALEGALAAAGAGRVEALDATALAAALLGDPIYANLLLLGIASQHGWLPVGAAALERAVELNGNAVAANLAAFRWGRLAAVDPEAVRAAAAPYLPEAVVETTLADVVERRTRFLAEYQDEAYAARYRTLVELARAAERERVGAEGAFADAVARSYFKLLAYKDEYEVARLHTLPEFRAAIDREFEGELRVEYHFAPPLFPGRPRKRRFGPWIRPLLGTLARLRRLRGTPFDPFGWTSERRRERALVAEYEATVRRLAGALAPANRAAATELAALPQRIRGYGEVKARAIAAVAAREAELRRAN